MTPSTPEQDAFVADAFGVDPTDYGAAPQMGAGTVTGGAADAGVAPPPSKDAGPAKTDGGAPPPAKPVTPTITGKCEASSPSNRARTKIGVGERVTLTVAPAPADWVATDGKLSDKKGATVTFTAPDRAAKPKITATVAGVDATIEFEVIEPSGVHMEVAGKLHKANGQPNAGMLTDIYIQPDTVNLEAVEVRELNSTASASGWWSSASTWTHMPPSMPEGTWLPVGKPASGKGGKVAGNDNCTSGFTGAPAPWTGQYSWTIPWQFKVGSGGAKTFATLTQSVVTDAAGVTTVSKAGASVSFALTDAAVSYPGAPY